MPEHHGNDSDDARYESEHNSDESNFDMDVDDDENELVIDDEDDEDVIGLGLARSFSDRFLHPHRRDLEDFDEADENDDEDEEPGPGRGRRLYGSPGQNLFSFLGRQRGSTGELNLDALLGEALGGALRAGGAPGLGGSGLGGSGLGSALGGALGGALGESGYGRILRLLRSPDDSSIISGLSDLSEMLLLPQSSLGFPVIPLEAVSKALVQILRSTENIEIQVMTARSIAQLLDNGPGTTTVRALVGAGLVPVMKRLFENVFYIDLIEQLVHVLKPVAFVEPRIVLCSGCLNPCVATLDFFNEHIQRQTMVAVESCTNAVEKDTLEAATTLLALFPETPSPTVLAAYSLLVIAIAKDGNIGEYVNARMFMVLVRAIQPGTPHVARVMRAVACVVARKPAYLAEIGEDGASHDHDEKAACNGDACNTLARTVVRTLLPTQTTPTDYFNRLISVPKDDVFSGLKLLQTLFATVQASKNIVQLARTCAPLVATAYAASTSSHIRQLAIHVVWQIASTLRRSVSPAQFHDLTHELGLLTFGAQILAEGENPVPLIVGGIDIVWELLTPENLKDIRNSGVSGDLETILNAAEPPRESAEISDDVVDVYRRERGVTGQLGGHPGALRAKEILTAVSSEEGASVNDALDAVSRVSSGDLGINELPLIPIANLLRTDIFSILEAQNVETHLSEPLVNLLQQAVQRLDKFPLELAGSRAYQGPRPNSLEDVLSGIVFIRIMDRSSPPDSVRAWTASVPVLATLESVEEFVRARLAAADSEVLDHQIIRFYKGNTRLPRDISIMKMVGLDSRGTAVISFEVVDEDDEDEVEEAKESAIPPQLRSVLNILRRLAIHNETQGEPVSWSAFRSPKLTAKLSRQLADILVVSASMLPQWTFDTVHEYPFLYPFEVRLHFVQLTSFGMGRNLRLLRHMQDEDDNENDDEGFSEDFDETSRILGRNKHQKFRLARENLLEGALRLLEHSSKSPAIIEVMFNNEEGTGRGPTQEFFALASKALSSPDLDIWTFTHQGLFPKPNMSPTPQILRYFRGMGVLVSRALLDKRILDFQLNPAFFEAVLDQKLSSVAKVRKIDPELASSLEKLLDTPAKDIAAMALDFTVPGSEEEELLPGGLDIDVTAENVGDYVALVCDRLVGSGIEQQIQAFVAGFSSTLPVSALGSFMLSELATLCGADRDEDWSVPTLRDALSFQHGYSMDSRAVGFLMNVLSRFTPNERRKFLVFITGSPHLPVGGFKALHPPLTVVVKPPEDESRSPDQYLPSVMTCVNYFKLPEYSSEDTLRTQLLTAMSEGSGSFPLS